MLPDFRLERFFARWEFRAKYNLAGSDAESLSIEELLALGPLEASDQFRQLRLGYSETWGSPALRQAIAAQYGLRAEQVICFAGAEEGIFCAAHALLQPGDHAVVTVPNYQSTEEIPLSICQVSGIALRESEHWNLDPDELRAALRTNTRLIAVNFPNNPTGKVIDPDTWQAVVAIAVERGIHLLSDEVYRGLERDSSRRLAPVATIYDRGLSLGVMSKALGLAGLRIGWIASRDTEALARMERVKHYLSIACSNPSEFLATVALGAADTILARNRGIVERNLSLIDQFGSRFEGLFEWEAPEGGCVAFPRYLGSDGVEEFCRSAVEDASVILLPASLFQSRLLPVPADRFRIGYGRKDFEAGLSVLSGHLAARESRGGLRPVLQP